MSDFVLIDLLAQREAVKRHVWGWTPEDMAAWMSKYGEVTCFPKFDTYAFRSNIDGRMTAFRFTERGELIILR